MAHRVPVVAIVGRTNVGKSSLFNALIGYRVAVVEDIPGVTRDRNYGFVKRFNFPFSVVDTGGLVGDDIDANLLAVIRRQTELAIDEADLVIAVFDGAAGVHHLDRDVVEILRRSKKPVIWVVNKTESPNALLTSGDFYQLGISDMVQVSAAHRQGLQELVAVIAEKLKIDPSEITLERPDDSSAIRVAILGKPNVGKSSLLNRLVGAERVVASELPGSTTDNIDVAVEHDGKKFVLVDTAGLRREKKISPRSVERYGNLRTLRALAQSDVALLVIDAIEGPSDQDIRIGELVHERGRGLIFVVNKWDAFEKDHRSAHVYREELRKIFRFAPYAPVVFVSALTGRKCVTLFETVEKVYQGARVRIPTSEINRVLAKAFESRPPPPYRGEPVKLYFATQVGVAPPQIVMFLNNPKRVPDSYVRYLKSTVRDTFPFEGVDIKFELRKRSEKQQRSIDGEQVAERGRSARPVKQSLDEDSALEEAELDDLEMEPKGGESI